MPGWPARRAGLPPSDFAGGESAARESVQKPGSCKTVGLAVAHLVSPLLAGGAMTTTLSAPELSTTDRCDRCNAQAYVRVVLSRGGDLQFCAHHWSRHEDALRPQAQDVIDETHRLVNAAAE